MSISSCNGVLEGGIYNVKQGSVTESLTSYSSLIAYKGSLYYLKNGTSLTLSNVTLTTTNAYQGGMIYLEQQSSAEINN